MIQFARVVCLSIAIMSVAGCASDDILAPPKGLPHAAATRTCAPNDGPAVAIYLSATPVEGYEPSPPYLRVAVWQSIEALKGRAPSMASSEVEGAAWFHSTTTNYEIATSGKVTVSSVSDDNRIEGTVDVSFPSGIRIRGGFKATWIPQTVMCG